MQLYGWGPFILSHQSAKFGIYRPCESGDIASLILSRDHFVDVSRDFMGGSLILSHHAAKFGVRRPGESGIIAFFYLSRDRDIEVSLDVVGGVESPYGPQT